jgi:hypothetical protein
MPPPPHVNFATLKKTLSCGDCAIGPAEGCDCREREAMNDAADGLAVRRNTAIGWVPRLGLYLRPGVDFVPLDNEIIEPISQPRRRKRVRH